MNRNALAITAAAVLLLLTGCTATGQPVIDSSQAIAGTTPSDAPLVAETPTAASDGGNTAFLAEVRAKLRPDNVIPNATDDQLLTAGKKACEVIASGADTNTASVIQDEDPDASGFFPDSATIIIAARANICGR